MNQGIDARPAREGARRLSVVHFLVALVVLLVVLPFLDQLDDGGIVETVLVTLVFLSAVMAVGGRRRTLIAGCVLVAPAVIAKWIDHIKPQAIPPEVILITAMVFSSFVVAHLFLFMLRAPQVDLEVLCAAIAGFLMLGFLGGFAFFLVARLDPQAFVFTVASEAGRPMTGIDALYFSFGTLTNYYGDIIPMSRTARTLSTVEATAGIFYMAILISRLVSLYPGLRRTEPAGPASDSASSPPSSENQAV